MDMLDIGTQLTLDAIWKEWVAETIQNHFLTGKTFHNNDDDDDDDWEFIQYISFTEPVWGIVVNK